MEASTSQSYLLYSGNDQPAPGEKVCRNFTRTIGQRLPSSRVTSLSASGGGPRQKT